MFLSTHKFNYIKNWHFLSKDYTTSLENDKKAMSFLYFINSILKGWRVKYIIATLAFTFGALVDWSFMSFFSRWIVSILENSKGTNAEIVKLLIVPIVAMTGLCIIQEIVCRTSMWYYNKTFEPTIDAKIKISYLSRTMENSYEYLTQTSTGFLSSSLTKILFNTKNFLKNICVMVFPSLITIFILLFSLLAIHWSLFLIATSFAILFTVVCVLSYNKIMKLQQKSVLAYGNTISVITDIIMNLSSVIFFCKKKQELQRVKRIQNFESKRIAKSLMFVEVIKIIRGALGIVISCALFYGIELYLYSQGKITIAGMVYAIGVSGSCWGLLASLQNTAFDLIRQVGEIKEGLNMMNKGKVAEHIHSREMLKVEKGNIEIKNAKFSYGKIKVFDGFNLSIKAGEKTGLVGKSGCGKTTLINLILRNLTLADGQILIDGKDIKNINEESLKDNFSFVSQDNTLFNRTVLENIRYAKQDATLEEVIEVAKKANAHEFITELEYGYETNVGERGMKLSGGQRQRILIARAMLKNAPILILDEATSALDAENETAIQESFERLMEGKTVIAISHKLHTLKNMDRIVVLKHGNIVEEGTHDKLINKEGGAYKKLWEKQEMKENLHCE